MSENQKRKRERRHVDILPRALSVEQAWTYIGVKRARFYQIAATGAITIHKIGIKSIIYLEDLDDFLDGIKDGSIKVAPKHNQKNPRAATSHAAEAVSTAPVA